MIIKNSKIPKWASIVIDVYAITLWPFVFIRDHGDEVTINHEKIHLRQQVELLREAYSMQNDMQYLSKSRRFWAWLTFL